MEYYGIICGHLLRADLLQGATCLLFIVFTVGHAARVKSGLHDFDVWKSEREVILQQCGFSSLFDDTSLKMRAFVK